MTAAVPDPRFRDQLAEAPTWRTEMWNRLSDLLGQHGPTIDSIDDDEHDELLTAFIDGLERDVLPKVCPTLPIAAEAEARVQAAASQRAVEFHRAENAEERGEGICRTCLAPIWNEGGTVGHRKRAEGWSDRIERGGDSLVCFKAIGYRHVPLAGREAAIYDHAAALASPAPAPRAEEDVCVHGHAIDDAHVCGAPR